MLDRKHCSPSTIKYLFERKRERDRVHLVLASGACVFICCLAVLITTVNKLACCFLIADVDDEDDDQDMAKSSAPIVGTMRPPMRSPDIVVDSN